MKKVILNLGLRNGFYQFVEGKKGTPEYKKYDEQYFSVVGRREYAIYDQFKQFVETQIVRVLATLTSTGKTRYVLVNDNFSEVIRKKGKELGIWFCHDIDRDYA